MHPDKALIIAKLAHLAPENPHMAPQPAFLEVKKGMLVGQLPGEAPESPKSPGLSADSPSDQLRGIADCIADSGTMHAEQLRALAEHLESLPDPE